MAAKGRAGLVRPLKLATPSETTVSRHHRRNSDRRAATLGGTGLWLGGRDSELTCVQSDHLEQTAWIFLPYSGAPCERSVLS